MKRSVIIIFLISLFFSCQESETLSEFTGNEATYDLQPGSTYDVSGTAIFKEKKDGSTLIQIVLLGTEGDVNLPTHLHYGDLSTPDAEIAAMLNPVIGSTGKSETTISQLADESAISYQELIALEASIKVHLSDVGPERMIILAAGNVGAAYTGSTNGRLGIGVCKSE